MSERDYVVTVCAECLTASCWHGEFMCERSRSAKTADRKASDLREARLEHADNFSPAKLLKVCGSVKWIGRETP